MRSHYAHVIWSRFKTRCKANKEHITLRKAINASFLNKFMGTKIYRMGFFFFFNQLTINIATAENKNAGTSS